MEDKQKTNNNFSSTGCFIAIVFLGIILFICFKMITGWWDNLGDSSTTNKNKEPDNVELMSYVQTVLKDNLNSPKYSNYKGDYNFVKTGLRYKIEGNVSVNGVQEKFYMVINFVDDTYQEYDLISLQVGSKKIY